ncbi:MAG: hypothetical protein COU40_01490 [Candidatus Moranbacteria bacterium CG10_big_fil_rev_8_21_14_0_10_35_21]|nr:MAG: hypothetical protein COU40_01490 [Candidatus Moranbacteria bacterium CG10_big_fil_rev_8_21_14_0_10_35_21]PJA88723.1 MAG: hypothetical protein CO139_01570 [Candidatus Moranbacteria bacterium CG_4_9_14_3_um_filter_36_9]
MNPGQIGEIIAKLKEKKSKKEMFVFLKHPTENDTRLIFLAVDAGVILDEGLEWVIFHDGAVEDQVPTHEIISVGIAENTFKKSKKAGLNKQFSEESSDNFNEGMKELYKKARKEGLLPVRL